MPRPAFLKPPSSETVALAGLAAGLLDLALAGMAVFAMVDAWAPSQDLAWKPLDLSRPRGMATGVQLARAAGDPAACREALTIAGARFAEAPVRSQVCPVEGAVRLTDGTTPMAPAAPAMSCRLALAYVAWDRYALRPAGAVRVDHYGVFSCRNIYGRTAAPRSQHAFANALDVAGVRLADGRRLTVAGDFRRDDARGRVMRALRDDACGLFRTTLSPDYNAAHRDHLHLEGGPPGRICR